ncbi:beta-galactosidase [Verrucomicrobia bacterium]|nr:beta-galactosidase [Verrucomicrobiota bacterium]
MFVGAAYYPEHWVYPFDGTEEQPESRWEVDANLMVKAGINSVRMGEFCWGLVEQEEGTYDFAWLRRAMDVFSKAGLKIILATPTAAPPVWLLQKYPEILPVDENGQRLNEGTRRAYSLNSNKYWELSTKIVKAMSEALGDHPGLIAWQIDNGIGRHQTEFSFNAETKRDWHAWLKQKYGTVESLNEKMGLRFWGQVVSKFEQVPMPMRAPAVHNGSLITDWKRFSSDTSVAYVRMQAELLHELHPALPVTTTIRPFATEIDQFDLADAVDFVAVDSPAPKGEKSAEVAMGIDLMRCLKKDGIKTPGDTGGFWVMEQKAGSASWQDISHVARPGEVRVFTYQLISRGANGVNYFYWRQPRVGPEKYYGGVLNHKGDGDNRMYREIQEITGELEKLAPRLKDTEVVAETCILISHENQWAQSHQLKPNRHFEQLEHIKLYYTALYNRNIPVDFARPTDDLSKYKLVIAPSLHLLAPGEADRLALYTYNGGMLIGTCNTSLVDEYNVAPNNGIPGEMTELFGLEVKEFDILPPGQDNSLNFKGNFQTSRLHPAKLWCDLIEPHKGTQVMATYTREFYAGTPAMTMNNFGEGKALYMGTISHQEFYDDLMFWIRQQCHLYPLLKVPDTIEVSMRQNEKSRVYILINQQETAVRIQFLKSIHDFLTGERISGNYDMKPRSILVLDEEI